MMRQNFTFVLVAMALTLASLASAKLAAETVPCRMGQASSNPDDDELPLCKKVDANPSPVVSHSRGPASVTPVRKAAPQVRRPVMVAVVRRAPASAVISNITFDEYMNQNVGHPALDGKIPDHQTAFVDPARVAVFTAPTESANPIDPAAVAPTATTLPTAGETQGYTLPPGVTLPAGYSLPAAPAGTTPPAGPLR